MASITCQAGVARSRLPGKADRNRYRYAVAVSSGIWRPEPSSPICIAYVAFQSRVFLPAYPLPDAPVGLSAIRKLGRTGGGRRSDGLLAHPLRKAREVLSRRFTPTDQTTASY